MDLIESRLQRELIQILGIPIAFTEQELPAGASAYGLLTLVQRADGDAINGVRYDYQLVLTAPAMPAPQRRRLHQTLARLALQLEQYSRRENYPASDIQCRLDALSDESAVLTIQVEHPSPIED